MDVGQVGLGRLWLFDKYVIIYDRSNIYQFEHEGKKIKLLPSLPKVGQPLHEIVYSFRLRQSIDLITIPDHYRAFESIFAFASYVHELHKEIGNRIVQKQHQL